MNKKAMDTLMENLVYILLVAVFIGMASFGLMRAGSNVTLYEQIHAKEIALLIDKSEPGMEVELNVYGLYVKAKKNKFEGQWVKIDNDENKVNIRLTEGEGYDYYFFNNADILWSLDKDKKILILKFVNGDEDE